MNIIIITMKYKYDYWGLGNHFQNYSHDANKNVTALFDASGNIAQTYDYSPFGKTLRVDSNSVNSNFSANSVTPENSVNSNSVTPENSVNSNSTNSNLPENFVNSANFTNSANSVTSNFATPKNSVNSNSNLLENSINSNFATPENSVNSATPENSVTSNSNLPENFSSFATSENSVTSNSTNSNLLENSELLSSTEIIENPFQFSSEYHDSELNLIYYNYRHYNPQTARWLSRDPIAESGGINLYNFVKNNSINKLDLLGLKRLTLTYNMSDELKWWKNLAGIDSNSWMSTLTDVITKIGGKYDKSGRDPCNCVEKLKIITHGSPGRLTYYKDSRKVDGVDIDLNDLNEYYFYNNNFNLFNNMQMKNDSNSTVQNVFRTYENILSMGAIGEYLCDTGEVIFLACNMTYNDGYIDGKQFLKELQKIMGGKKVIGYDTKVLITIGGGSLQLPWR